MKLLVYVSLSLEILQTVLVTHDTYLTFAKMYGNLMGLDNLHYLWLTLPIMGGLGEQLQIRLSPVLDD